MKRIREREQILLGGGDVGKWGGNLQYVCSDGKCFDFVVIFTRKRYHLLHPF